MDSENLNMAFANTLLKWNKTHNKRQMPWKGEKNPYFIWLSEIILQQTRVEQGLPYYQRFIKQFPTVQHLANAPLDVVMAAWQGLGYYSRARNLQSAAQYVTTELKGVFPTKYEDILKLKGVGDYTAAAIASFAYNEARAVIDGNVIRVLARIFGITTPYDTTAGKKQFTTLAQQLLDKKKAGIYNQAIMDFGALICTPKNPQCQVCPFQKTCAAFQQNLIDTLPVKSKKIKLKERFFHYLLIVADGKILIEQRKKKDIWQNLYQLPLIETGNATPPSLAAIKKLTGLKNVKVKQQEPATTQLLSHQKIYFTFTELNGTTITNVKITDCLWVSLKNLKQFAFPRTIHLFLKQNSLL
ncbi:MAG: A/G-specific adenine glycosylase [Chitinophagales bacterium]